MSDTVNIGIVGAGGMGGRHARNLNDAVAAANVAAIMDVDTARAPADGGQVWRRDPLQRCQ